MTDDLGTWLKSFIEEVRHEVEEYVEVAAVTAEAAMKEQVDASGAEPNWVQTDRWMSAQTDLGREPATRTGSTPGRTHTGRMREGIKVKHTKTSDGGVTEVGWLDDKGEGLDEFVGETGHPLVRDSIMAQEYGFMYMMDDGSPLWWVPGVGALDTGAMIVEEILRSARGKNWRAV